jgi:hypothetical protein
MQNSMKRSRYLFNIERKLNSPYLRLGAVGDDNTMAK